MPEIERIVEFQDEMTAWRRDFHAHPEIGFEEERTSEFVATKLEEFGIRVHRGLAKTGLVGTLSNGEGPALALRADMDALPITEIADIPHKSTNLGRMHACGHDGHTTMLLGAAKYLAETRNFRGTVQFIFQPAEEGQGGGRVMVEEGLFEKFPAESVFALHNWPDIPEGTFATIRGPHLAAADEFRIVVTGKGGHGAFPHRGNDPMVIGAEIVLALQSFTTRKISPLDNAVISVCQFHAGETYNVVPETVHLGGTTRSFRLEVQDAIEAGIQRIATGVCAAHGAAVEVVYQRGYPPMINDAAEAEFAAKAAVQVVGEENVDLNPVPCMGAEDFSYMLQAKPGCFMWIGTGPDDGTRTIHGATFDFPDVILAKGASFFAKVVEMKLG